MCTTLFSSRHPRTRFSRTWSCDRAVRATAVARAMVEHTHECTHGTAAEMPVHATPRRAIQHLPACTKHTRTTQGRKGPALTAAVRQLGGQAPSLRRVLAPHSSSPGPFPLPGWATSPFKPALLPNPSLAAPPPSPPPPPRAEAPGGPAGRAAGARHWRPPWDGKHRGLLPRRPILWTWHRRHEAPRVPCRARARQAQR